MTQIDATPPGELLIERKHNLTATTNPGVGDDSGDGYGVGSMWVNVTDDVVWQAVDVAVGAAVWQLMSAYRDLVAEGMGFTWEASSRLGGGSGLAVTSGTQYYVLSPLVPGRTINGIAYDVQTGGSSLSLVKSALIATDGTLLASSADVKASFTSAGIKDASFGSPYTPTDYGSAYSVFLCTHTGTGPALVRDQTSYDPNVYGGNARAMGSTTGLTDISATVPALAAARSWWMAHT